MSVGLALSFLMCFICIMVTKSYEYPTEAIALFCRGDLSNIGTDLGIRGYASLLPLVAVWAWAGWCLRRYFLPAEASKLMLWLLGGYLWLFLHRPFEVWPGTRQSPRRAGLYDRHMPVLVGGRGENLDLQPFELGICRVLVRDGRLLRLQPVQQQRGRLFQDLAALSALDHDGTQRAGLAVHRIGLPHRHGTVYGAFLPGVPLRTAHEYRMGIARMSGVDIAHCDPNTFAANILYALPLLYPVWAPGPPAVAPRAAGGLRGAVAGVHFVYRFAERFFVGLCSLAVLAAILCRRRRWTIVAGLLVAVPLVWSSLDDSLPAPVPDGRRFLLRSRQCEDVGG